MAREASITHEQVAAVADAIKAEGGKPTLRAVRERLGTGSLGTIQSMLARWKASQDRQAGATLALPPALQRAILEFMDQELTSARAPLEADLAQEQQASADLATENERLLNQIYGLENGLENLQEEKAKAEGQAKQLEADLATTRAEADRARTEAESARTELAKASLRLEAMPRLEAEIERLRKTLETSQEGRQQAEQLAAVNAAKLEASERRAGETEAREKVLQDRAGEADRQAQATARELSSANLAVQAGQARLESAARELEDVRRQIREAREEAREARDVAAELRGQMQASPNDGKPAKPERPKKTPATRGE